MRPFSVTPLFVVGWYSSQFLIAAISFFVCCCLTLFVPSNSEGVASPGPSNIGAKRSKVWVEQENPDKNALISTVSIAVWPSLTQFHSLLPSLLRITHPSTVQVINFTLVIIIHERYIADASQTNISLTSHYIFADLYIKIMQ